MKKERWYEEDGKIVHHQQFDYNPSLKRAKELRDRGMEKSVFNSDSYHVGSVPMPLVTFWLKQAGVRWDDPAAKDVVMRNLQDPQWKHLRVWGGKL